MQTLTFSTRSCTLGTGAPTTSDCITAGLADAPTEDVLAVAALSGLLGQPTRVRIVCLLASHDRNVGDLCGALGLPQPTVSHHLGLLRRGGVLDCRRAGKQVYYGWSQRVVLDTDGTLTLNARGVSVRVRLPAADPTSPSSMAGQPEDSVPEGEAAVALAVG